MFGGGVCVEGGREVKIKVHIALEQAIKAQKGNRSIALLFL